MKIMVIDDNRGLAHILKIMLKDECHQVTFARNRKDAYLTYLLFTPDVVITDIPGPGESGFELLEKIRMHNPEVKTIYTCGDLIRSRPVLKEEETKFHVGILQRPFSKNELLRSLSRFSNHDRLELKTDS